MKQTLLVILSIVVINTLHAQDVEYRSPLPKFTPYQSSTAIDSNEILNYDARELGLEQPARWLSVDPMADKYPGWSPYNYCLNNPLRIIDPNGMWTADYDKCDNIVTVNYEKGDTYENLYKQLGLNAEQFHDKYGVDLSTGPTVGESFDITSQVINKTNFNGDFDGSNCHGFTIFAKGKSVNESNTPGNELFGKLGNPSPVSSPLTGDVAVWTTKGSLDGVDLTGDPAHSGIFIINNSKGDAQFINRLGTNHPVTTGSNSEITGFYNNQMQDFQAKYNMTLPTMSNTPTYYRTK